MDISIAVATPKGLVVPVLRNADQLSFAAIEKNLGALGKKARDGTISIDDMAGGTFTISNGGVYGSMMSTPIINPPQVRARQGKGAREQGEGCAGFWWRERVGHSLLAGAQLK